MPTAAIMGTRTARTPAYVPVLASLVSLVLGASAVFVGRVEVVGVSEGEGLAEGEGVSD